MNSGFDQDAPPLVPEGSALDVQDNDDYDALADLFLGEETPDPGGPIPFPSATQSAEAPPYTADVLVEGLIVGHLPVLASAWVRQYARHRASELDQPIALLRLSDGTVAIDLIGAGHAPEAHSLDEAIRIAHHAGAAWIVRVDEPEEPRLAEADIDELTLLTGADQAAIVASYRVIKRLAAIADADGDTAHVRIAAMGSNRQAAATIGEKISRAATTFLGCEVEVSSVVERIEPGRSRSIFEGAADASIDEIVDRLRGEPPAPVETPEVTIPASKPARPPRQEARREAEKPSPPTPTQRIEGPAPAASSDDARLASHVPGLEPLALTCPYAPDVELARDEASRLHLLIRSSSSPGGPASVGALLATRQWAEAHAPLLGAASASLDARDAVLHLLTDDVPSVRRLLDTSIRVHLLAPVTVEGRRTWFSTPLN